MTSKNSEHARLNEQEDVTTGKGEALSQAARLWMRVASPADFDENAVMAYVENQLDAAECEAFEVLMDADPRLAARVEKAQRKARASSGSLEARADDGWLEPSRARIVGGLGLVLLIVLVWWLLVGAHPF